MEGSNQDPHRNFNDMQLSVKLIKKLIACPNLNRRINNNIIGREGEYPTPLYSTVSVI